MEVNSNFALLPETATAKWAELLLSTIVATVSAEIPASSHVCKTVTGFMVVRPTSTTAQPAWEGTPDRHLVYKIAMAIGAEQPISTIVKSV